LIVQVSGPADIDGLGRLKDARETISYPGQSNRTHDLSYNYDMLNQLTSADISNIGGSPWTCYYYYKKDGNIYRKTVNSVDTLYQYDTTPGGDVFDSDIMTKIGSDPLVWDANGRLAATTTPAVSLTYNADGKLRYAGIGDDDSVALKYDLMGNRVWKQSTVSGQTTTRKYIVDIAGRLPTILCEIDPIVSSLKKSYPEKSGRPMAKSSSRPSMILPSRTIISISTIDWGQCD
jgi:hypothetical protein